MLPSNKNPDKNLQKLQVISDNITKLIIYKPPGVINNNINLKVNNINVNLFWVYSPPLAAII